MEVVVEGNCYVFDMFERCCVGIENGKIVRIAKIIEGDRVYRYNNKIVLPAAIDAHVHFREPGMTNKEDFGTGSLAALHGGVSCAFDMPNTIPPTVSVPALREKRKIASSKSYCDFGLYAGVKQGIDVDSLAKEAIGFKLYMAGTTGDLAVPSPEILGSELAEIAKTGKMLAVHAEDEKLRKKDIAESLDGHLRNRSNDCEASAIRKARDVAKECRLHICHVSAKESLPLILNAENLTSEVTPHHLLLDKESKLGTLAKVNPPLRRREDRFALFQALKDGSFDLVASDHAPHTIDEKQEDFDYAPSGMPGVETMVPLLLHLVKEKHLSIEEVVRRVCSTPGRLFGIRKGMIAEGYDADFIVVDMSASSPIESDKLNSKCGWSAYEGMPAVFPKAVFLRGQIMMEDDNLVGERIGREVLEQSRQA